jgi:uncharacterized tellurite resistance protein B-like protein
MSGADGMQDGEQLQEKKDKIIERLNNLNKEQLEQLIEYLHNIFHID